MAQVIYKIVQHDGGWAYQVNGAFSETFVSHDSAREAARHAARMQATTPGETTVISYEDPEGNWHDEVSPGTDRPETRVVEG